MSDIELNMWAVQNGDLEKVKEFVEKVNLN